MSFWATILRAWDWEPSVIAGCFGLVLGYAVLSQFRWRGQGTYFVAGVVVLFLALVSPIDTLSDHYLFSAHMFQHLLLSQIVPPLLLLGIPAAWWERLLQWNGFAVAERWLRRPLAAWLIGVGALWIWHWPPLFGLALENESIHVAQHLCFLVTGCIFWWPVISPVAGHRMTVLPAVLYLFTACTVSSLLGMYITFSGAELYPMYASGADPLGILAGLRSQISLHEDQQLGGLMMWVPCCLIYAAGIITTLAAWQSAEERESGAPVRSLAS